MINEKRNQIKENLEGASITHKQLKRTYAILICFQKSAGLMNQALR